jgi:hypothetical protein
VRTSEVTQERNVVDSGKKYRRKLRRYKYEMEKRNRRKGQKSDDIKWTNESSGNGKRGISERKVQGRKEARDYYTKKIISCCTSTVLCTS